MKNRENKLIKRSKNKSIVCERQKSKQAEAYRKDVAYFAMLNIALSEWLSAYDEEAYNDL
jgi:hypothetical protein